MLLIGGLGRAKLVRNHVKRTGRVLFQAGTATSARQQHQSSRIVWTRRNQGGREATACSWGSLMSKARGSDALGSEEKKLRELKMIM